MEPVIPKTLIYCPESAFLAPYMGAEFGHDSVFVCKILPQELPADIANAVMISSTGIYNVQGGKHVSEDTSLDTSSQFAGYETEFKHFAEQYGLPYVILRCANIVGTGMNGFAMRLARGIDNGLLFHIRGNEAEISVVHAVDVAAVAHKLIDSVADGRTYNVTDGNATPIDRLIDALAHRINNKNVMTVSPKIARLLYGKSYFQQMTTTLTFDSARLMEATQGMCMHDVCDYLMTHVYDEDSL